MTHTRGPAVPPRHAFCGIAALLLTVVLLAALGTRATDAGEQPSALAKRVQAILEKKCASCHGANDAVKVGLNITRRENLVVQKRVVVPKDPDKSDLIHRVDSDSMPPTSDKLSPDQKKALRDWVAAGAPDWDASAPSAAPRKRITEREILNAVIRSLEAADIRDRPFLRYFSLANLYNNSEVSDDRLKLYRTTLSKLANSLSWRRVISVPKAIDPQQTLLRIDLRDFDWTPEIWNKILALHPYGYIPREVEGGVGRSLQGEFDQVRVLSGARLPYLRVDWFVAHASLPPLYHDILQLPDNVQDLERKVGVDARRDLALNRALRAGRRDSGVSRNNRVVQRHDSLYGAYWKSFDFAGNQADQNIFKNPIHFKEDGGEFIFHLPNGLQGYLIANAQGARLDEAPVNIVFDRNNKQDPVVRNGLSCIGCHFQGMNTFMDQVRPTLELFVKQRVAFDVDEAMRLYPPQADVDAKFKEDNQRFADALQKTGSPLPTSYLDEPVYLLSLGYYGYLDAPSVSVAQAAADVLLDVKEFQRRVGKSSLLERLGFNQLLEPNGGIKRDAWEEYFPQVIEELGLGTPIKAAAHPELAHPVGESHDRRKTLSLGEVIVQNAGDTQHRELAGQVRQALSYWLGKSDDLRLVAGNADCSLRGTLTVKSVQGGFVNRGRLLEKPLLIKPRNEITLRVGDPALGLTEEASGPAADVHTLTMQVANRLNLRLTGRLLSVDGAAGAGGGPGAGSTTPAGPVAGAVVPADFAQKLQQSLGAGTVKVQLSMDRGPGAVYRFGDKVQILVSVDRECYLTLYNVDSTGNVNLVFPNQFVKNNRVHAGQVLTIGGPNDPFEIEAGGTEGLETVVAVATLTQVPLPGLEDGKPAVGAVSDSPDEAYKTLVVKLKPGAGGSGNPGGGGATVASVRFYTMK
jgi:mono/diheme cytochrome c family protein